jgi:hypothetical protein
MCLRNFAAVEPHLARPCARPAAYDRPADAPRVAGTQGAVEGDAGRTTGSAAHLGLVRRAGHKEASGGRRAEVLEVNDAGRSALVADLGQSHATSAVVISEGGVRPRAHANRSFAGPVTRLPTRAE